MENKLYVGNIHFEVNEEDLKKVFEEAGAVTSCKIIKDKFTGVSKGFGFIEMETEEAAKKAIETLNGREVNARAIKVAQATGPKSPPTGGGGSFRDHRPGGGFRSRNGGGGHRSGNHGGGVDSPF